MTAAESEVELVSVYCFTVSTQISIRARVPVMLALACASTDGEEMEEPVAGAQICTPGDVGAVQLEGTAKVKLYPMSELSKSAA